MAVALMKTAAEQQLAAEWQEAAPRLPGPAALRAAAFEQFAEAGLPSRRVEEWKYTDLRALMRDAKPLAEPPDATRGKPSLIDALPGVDAHRVAIVNGTYLPAWSDLAGADLGVTLIDLFAWVGDNLSAWQDLVADENDLATSLNRAFMTGGVVLRVRKGARVAKPIHVAHAFCGDQPAAMYPRTIVLVEPGAQATLIETFAGPAASDYQVNA